MSEFGVFIHSPFSEKNILKGNNKSLLLQFILTDLFSSKTSQIKNETLDKIFFPVSSSFYPLDWTSQRGYLNKVLEHSLLLKEAFPEKKESIAIFKHSLLNTTIAITNQIEQKSQTFDLQLSLYIKQLYLTLEPIMHDCMEDENFLYFLIKNQEIISKITHESYLVSFLEKKFQEGLDSLCKSMCDKFHLRGFAFLIPEVKTSIAYLKNKE